MSLDLEGCYRQNTLSSWKLDLMINPKNIKSYDIKEGWSEPKTYWYTAFDCRILAGNGGKLRCSQAELTPTIKAAVDMFSSISCRYPEIEGGILEDFPSHPVTEPFGFTKALGALSRNNVENTERALKGSEGRGDRSMLCFARPICLYSDEWSDDGASTHDVCVHFGLKPPPFAPCTG